jgi:hypothetical protein
MSKGQVSSVGNEEVLLKAPVYSFCPSVMKEFLETVKWMVLHDKRQKSVIFKIRVDV